MTEQEWLTSRDPGPMLRWMRVPGTVFRTRWQGPVEAAPSWKTSERKLRLFVLGCCRFADSPRDANRAINDAVEDWIEGRLSRDHLDELIANARRWADLSDDVARVTLAQPRIELSDPAIVELMCSAYAMTGVRWGHAGLLRDIVGNPFRPVAIDPTWLRWNDSTVPRLARAIFDARSFADLPILADALEEAECGDDRILGHLRSPGPHVPGCWAVDLLLGKA